MSNDRIKLSGNKWVDEFAQKLWPESEDYDEKLIFYLGYFAEPYTTLFKELIKPLVESFGFKCLRDDENPFSQEFMPRLLKNIKLCRLLLVDLSKARPNVMYELGWADALAASKIIFTTTSRPTDIAGKQIANPSSFLLSMKMMFDWLAMKHNDSKCNEIAEKFNIKTAW